MIFLIHMYHCCCKSKSNSNIEGFNYDALYNSKKLVVDELVVNSHATIGPAYIGPLTGNNDYATFSHKNKKGIGEYAMLHQGNGTTYLNSASNKNIIFRTNNINDKTYKDGKFNNIEATGTVKGNVLDIAVNGTIGPAYIGGHGTTNATRAADTTKAQFSHKNSNGVNDYGLIHRNTGETLINAKSGQNINFRTNNTNNKTYKDGKFNNIEVTGNIQGNQLDITKNATIGPAYIGGYGATDEARLRDAGHAQFSHKDRKHTHDFALMQRNDGHTWLNSKSGKGINIEVGRSGRITTRTDGNTLARTTSTGTINASSGNITAAAGNIIATTGDIKATSGDFIAGTMILNDDITTLSAHASSTHAPVSAPSRGISVPSRGRGG